MWHFLFKSAPGTIILLVCGLFCAGVGAVGINEHEEMAPTQLNLAEYETTGSKNTSAKWLEISNVYILWEQRQEQVRWQTDRWGNKIGKEQVSYVYVPIISQEHYERGGHGARAFVRFPPKSNNPNDVLVGMGNVELRPKLMGVGAPLADEDRTVRDGLVGGNVDTERMLVLRYNERTLSQGALTGLAIACFVVALALVTPFILFATNRSEKKKPKRRRRRDDDDDDDDDTFDRRQRRSRYEL